MHAWDMTSSYTRQAIVAMLVLLVVVNIYLAATFVHKPKASIPTPLRYRYPWPTSVATPRIARRTARHQAPAKTAKEVSMVTLTQGGNMKPAPQHVPDTVATSPSRVSSSSPSPVPVIHSRGPSSSPLDTLGQPSQARVPIASEGGTETVHPSPNSPNTKTKETGKSGAKVPMIERYVKQEPVPSDKMHVASIASYPGEREEYRILAGQLKQVAWDRIVESQNPKDCSTADVIRCTTTSCGFGCQLHHYAYCLLAAVAEGRVVRMAGDFSYAGKKDCGKERTLFCFVQRFGRCTNRELDMTKGRSRVIVFRAETKYQYWSPPDIRDDIYKIHPSPGLWFASIIIKYILRPNDRVHQEFRKRDVALFNSTKETTVRGGGGHVTEPIIGVHVRHGDKALEAGKAGLYPLSMYVDFVRQWGGTTVYLATDDRRILEATRDYPEITWLSGKDRRGHASGTSMKRRGWDAMVSLLYDLHRLGQCTRFIGTSSSQISRTVYELLNYQHTNAVKYAVDLDLLRNRKRAGFWWYFV